MEVRTIYVAFPGTSYETSFKAEEECRNYEQTMTPEMWDTDGIRTFNGEEAMFVKVDEDMMPVLFDEYGKENFPGLDEEDYGYFYWDDYDEIFHRLDEATMRRVQKFMDRHEITSCSRYSRWQGSSCEY